MAIAAVASDIPAGVEQSSGRFGQVLVRKITPDNNYIANPQNIPYEWVYIEDKSTGNLYLNESRATVAVKQFMIIVGAPIYTSGKIIANFAKIFIDTARIGYMTIAQFGVEWSKGAKVAAKFVARQVCIEIPKNVGKDIWNIVSAPLFATAMVLCCLYGLLTWSPYEGRVLVAKVDNAWQNGISRKEDISWCNVMGCEVAKKFKNKSLADKMHNTSVHFALCFQIQNNLDKPIAQIRLEVIRRGPVGQFPYASP